MLAAMRELHMIRCRFDLPAMMRRIGASPRDAASFDVGYLVHWQMVSLFGDDAPASFSIRDVQSRWIEVLGYTSRDAESLRGRASGADESARAACDWAVFGSKSMPAAWSPGRRYGFETRVCPVIRRSAASAHGKQGAEIDVYLQACERAPGSPVDRVAVYRNWIAARVEAQGAAVARSVEIRAYRRVRLHRRTQGVDRRARALDRPDVEAAGVIEVRDPDAFDGLVRRGLGRHRAFGFGMLLLRPEA